MIGGVGATVTAVIAVVLTASVARADDSEPTKAETKANKNEFIVDLLEARKEQPREPDVVATQVDYDVVPVCAIGGIDVCKRDARCPDGELMYNVYVVTDGVRSDTATPRCFEDAEPQASRAITNGMVRRALRRVSLPEPALSIQPPGGKTLVNFETIFSTDADSFRRTVRLLGHRVQLDITPTAYVWSYGDGTSETTNEPGVAYQSELPMSVYLTHLYEDADVTMQPRVAVTYGARFRVDGGPWRDVSGTVTSQGAPVDLRVVEAQPVLLGGY